MKYCLSLCLIVFVIVGCKNQNMPENFDYGTIEDNIYRNEYFDVEFTFDSKWHIQTQEDMDDLMKAGEELLPEDKNIEEVLKASEINTATLFSIFKHELGSAVDFNPSFLLFVENIKNFEGIETGKDYLEYYKESNKEAVESSPVSYKFDNDIYTTTISGQKFNVLEYELLLMGQEVHQKYFTMVSRGFTFNFFMSFTNDEEKQELQKILDSVKL